MFSAYVVVGAAADGAGDHGADAVGGDRTAEHGIEVGLGHLGDGLDVAEVLGGQRDHGGQGQQDEDQRERREVPAHVGVAGREGLVPDESVDGLGGEAEPVGATHRVPVDPVVGTGLRVAGQRQAGLAEDRVEDPRQQVAEDQAHEDRDPAEEALEPDGHQDHREHGEDRHPRVGRHVGLGGDRGEVEPDQHHNRTRHGGRQHLVDDLGAEVVDDHADDREDDAGDQDRSGDVSGTTGAALTVVGVDSGGRADERRTGAEVAGHLALDDEQEADRRDATHHDSQVGVQAHDQREDERRPEHRHDVLGTEPDRLAPRQPLVRRDGLTGGRIDHFPLEHRRRCSHQPAPFPWEILQISPPRTHNVVRAITHPRQRNLPKERRSRWQDMRQPAISRTRSATATSRRRCGSDESGPSSRSSLETR